MIPETSQRQEARERPRAAGATPAAIGLGVILGVQLLRAYLPLVTFHLYDFLGLTALATALVSLLFFSAGFGAARLCRRLGWLGAIRLTVALLAVLRTWEQLAMRPAVDLWLAAAGTSLLCLLLSLVLMGGDRPASAPGGTAFAVLIALAVETTIRTAAQSLDLSWRADWWAHALVLGVSGLALAVTVLPPAAPRQGGPTAIRPWAWLGLGAWLTLYLLVFSNPSHLAARAGMPLSRAGGFVLGAWVLGLLVAPVVHRWSRPTWLAVEASALAAVGAWAAFDGGPDAWFGYLVGGPAMAVLLVELLLGGTPVRSRRPLAAGGAGPVLLLMIYLHYGRFGQSLGLSERAVWLVGAGLLAGAAVATAWRRSVASGSMPRRALPAVLTAAAALAVAGLALRSEAPAAGAPATERVRVMAYNLHQGFSVDGRLDPEALARVIEAEGPDVVALQEVARGWLVTGGFDLYDWLTRRLEMNGRFAGTADPQWGNAVLGRLPIVAAAYQPLPPPDLPLRRGVLDVTFEAFGGRLRVLCLHLHHRWRDDAIRVRQTEALLEIWGGSPTTLLLGDFNAEPGSGAIRALRAAGLHDASALLPAARRATSVGPGFRRQIDWIFATPDLAFEATSVPFSQASDHLPVATSVRLRQPPSPA